MIEFLVDAHSETKNGAIVTGLVNSGTVSLGNRFKFVYSSTTTKEPKPVSFEVTRIMAYGHKLDQLPEGMTGELVLVGDGIERLEHGIFLVQDDE